MSTQSIIILLLIGIVAGLVSGFVGIGGGIIIVPALVYFMQLSQHEAQGTSLFLMLPPIGIFAVMNYYKAGQLNFTYGTIIALAFIIGAYFGSKLALKISPSIVKFFFGIFLVYVSFKMIISGYNGWKNE